MPDAPHILAVPNDDGFGPSALLSYVVKAILKAEPRARVKVWNEFASDFNRVLYKGGRRVTVERVWNLVQLVRKDGVVSKRSTLQRMGGYAQASTGYGSREQFDLVLDFGVPAAAAWARRRGVPSVSVFDHSWSKSLAMIAGKRPGVRWQRLVDEVAADEQQATQVHLFPDLIAPGLFREHWEGLVGASSVHVLDGVLRETSPWSRERARQFLGLTRPGSTVLVQGGGTSVWSSPLRRLLGQLLDPASRRRLSRAQLNLVVWFPENLISDSEARALERLARVRRLTPPPGGTIQKILPAIDSLILRAGGGSVNDAIAHRKPFVCIREPAQLQIEAILEVCTERGLTWPIEITDFAADPLGVILHQERRLQEQRAALIRRMSAIPNNAATGLAERIISVVR
jgi:hypothetical protein